MISPDIETILPEDIREEMRKALNAFLPESVKDTISDIDMRWIDYEIAVAREYGLRWDDRTEAWEVIEQDERVKRARVRRDAEMHEELRIWLDRQPWGN
jgi:hypothetical protein